MSTMNQKDYLKKYLSLGKDSTEKKKKKKKPKSNIAASRLVIIDDNADTFENAVREDMLEDEDAPQIVAVIDDRPPSLRVDEKSNTNLWIPIGSTNESSLGSFSDSPKRKNNFEDLSPPRSRMKQSPKKNEDMSPPRKERSSLKHHSVKNHDCRSIKIKEMNRDISPPRKNTSTPARAFNEKKPRSRENAELFRQTCDEYESEKNDDDNSPPRKTNQAASSRIIEEKNSNKKVDAKYMNDDMSPLRKRRREISPKMENRKKTSRWESEISDLPPSKYDNENLKRMINDEDNSPPRKRSGSSMPTKAIKTLDGKSAGLQNSKQLAVETTLIKKKERDDFNQMSREISGANATTIVRDKKTGRARNFQEEAARELEKKKQEDENKEKYSRWGRGLKQIEDATKRRDEEFNEMSKPLARYANDEDLERYLKEQERDGDPMLAYIRKKKKKKDVEEGKPIKPEYMGEFMPNRFAIRPGHRWDGVDRSNGYEKKWFDIQNAKLAQQEEAYKWSTEEM